MTVAPDVTPLFPLPDVVFFPKTLLPLHVYEPRYRALAAEALEQGRAICTALLKPGWEADYYGSPEVYPVGCVGRIVHHQKLPDGRYNITLGSGSHSQRFYDAPLREGEILSLVYRLAVSQRQDERPGGP